MILRSFCIHVDFSRFEMCFEKLYLSFYIRKYIDCFNIYFTLIVVLNNILWKIPSNPFWIFVQHLWFEKLLENHVA